MSLTTYQIPAQNLATFQAAIAKLAKKAARFGIELPSYRVTGEQVRDRNGSPTLIHTIALESSLIVVAGYTFAATIEHTEAGNILHSRTSETLPLQYRTVEPWCEHCRTVRRRNDTFLMRSDAGTYIQLGRNCLVDFLGHDAEDLARRAEYLFELDELCEGAESYSDSAGERLTYLAPYLGFVAECISRYGWLSKGAAREQGRENQATASQASAIMNPSPEERSKLEWLAPGAESVAMAEASIEWAAAISDAEAEESDYLYTIRLIARRGIVGSRHFGYAASIVSGYQRHLGDLKRREREAARGAGQYVSEVGKRQIFRLTVEKAISLPDYGYGSSTLYIMCDSEGNCITWKSSSRADLDVGCDVVLRGTVKEHKEYNGTRQTILTRCKVES